MCVGYVCILCVCDVHGVCGVRGCMCECAVSFLKFNSMATLGLFCHFTHPVIARWLSWPMGGENHYCSDMAMGEVLVLDTEGRHRGDMFLWDFKESSGCY